MGKHLLLAIWMVGLLACMPLQAQAASSGHVADALDDISGLIRSADRAREGLDNVIRQGDNDRYDRYDHTWRGHENRLEQARVRELARASGKSHSHIEDLRKSGQGWGAIARRLGVDPKVLGYGTSRFDKERDSWKGTPPGLAKKGGLPPGQAKKQRSHRDDDRSPGRTGGNKQSGKHKDK